MAKHERRTADTRIAELEEKIKGIREREERRKAKNDPVVRETRVAMKALVRALNATSNEDMRVSLIEARDGVEAITKVAVANVTATPVAAPKTTRKPRSQA